MVCEVSLAWSIQTFTTLGVNGLSVCGYTRTHAPHRPLHTQTEEAAEFHVCISAGLRRCEEVTACWQGAGENATNTNLRALDFLHTWNWRPGGWNSADLWLQVM